MNQRTRYSTNHNGDGRAFVISQGPSGMRVVKSFEGPDALHHAARLADQLQAAHDRVRAAS